MRRTTIICITVAFLAFVTGYAYMITSKCEEPIEVISTAVESSIDERDYITIEGVDYPLPLFKLYTMHEPDASFKFPDNSVGTDVYAKDRGHIDDPIPADTYDPHLTTSLREDRWRTSSYPRWVTDCHLEDDGMKCLEDGKEVKQQHFTWLNYVTNRDAILSWELNCDLICIDNQGVVRGRISPEAREWRERNCELVKPGQYICKWAEQQKFG